MNLFKAISGWSGWSSLKPATTRDLIEMEKRIMRTQADLVNDLNAVTGQVQKIGVETAATLQKVTDLEAALKAGGPLTPETEAALAALKTQAQVTDDMVPDAPAAPPEPPEQP
jgi:hypothetical protein